MAKAWERLLLAFLQRLFPAIVDIRFPMEWTFHQSSIISLDHPNPAMVREIAARLWDTPWFRAARLTIFTDAAVVSPEAPDLSWRCINLVERTDCLFHDNTGTRLALDATGRAIGRHPLRPDPLTSERVNRRWREYGLN